MRKQDWLVQRSGLRWLQRIDAIKAEPPVLFLLKKTKCGTRLRKQGATTWSRTGGGGELGLIFAGYVQLASESPYPIRDYSVANYTPHPSHFWQICNFSDSNSVTFSCFELTHSLDWMQGSQWKAAPGDWSPLTLGFIASYFISDHLLLKNLLRTLWMKNTLLFICSTNILVRLPTVNLNNCLTPKNSKMCYPILVTLLKMRPHYSPVVKMRPHPAARPH